jgi:hypothetical protein
MASLLAERAKLTRRRPLVRDLAHKPLRFDARPGSVPRHARLAGPALDEPKADQGGGEAVEAVEDVGPPLVADDEP